MSPKSFEAVWLKFVEMNLAKNFASRREILSRFPSRSHFYFGHQGSCRDSRKHPSKILAAEKLLLSKNLDEIRGRIPVRFWPPTFLLHGEISGRIAARFWPLGSLLPGKNLAGILAAAILAGFLSRSQRAPVQIPVLISHRLSLELFFQHFNKLLPFWNSSRNCLYYHHGRLFVYLHVHICRSRCN